ncbi:cutinase [Trichodelitschia bisporula]|uniref:Cutinase n=1 Tax=Trichodelitschia bisporula TaxID=703511 RepID=A0A6G1HZ69_9PEZI|nr:cutinase [Trichodelitschia bisporula]
MNDLVNGQCKMVTFIFARATTEAGNMGAAAGSGVARYLAGHYGLPNVAIQGVKYPADIAGNLMPGGCSSAGISESVRLFNLANTKCPETIIVAGGYSQGTACMHRSIPKLTAAVQSKIVGVVLFGDTQAAQTGRKIQGLGPEKVKIYCNTGDGVCGGTLAITTAHFQYTPFVAPATQFLIERIDAKQFMFPMIGSKK